MFLDEPWFTGAELEQPAVGEPHAIAAPEYVKRSKVGIANIFIDFLPENFGLFPLE